MTDVILDSTVKGRKHHQCYHCYRSIAPREAHRKVTYKCDGCVYSMRFHVDCQALWDKFEADGGYCFYDFDAGYPPLYDEWCGSEEVESLCDFYRGHFPHAVTRIEHNLSDAEDMHRARLAKQEARRREEAE